MKKISREELIVFLDTNIYGWALAPLKKEEAEASKYLLEKLLAEKDKLEPRVNALSCETILSELEKTKKRGLRNDLLDLHNSVVLGIIKHTKRMEKLAREYFSVCKSRKIRITIEDCRISASATLAGAKFIVTENRMTMRNPRVIEVYGEVNNRMKLITPKFVSARDALKKFFP